ncbi:MAG: hypothetical protein EZS28_033105 [Streblomastix strix]|uniref:Uncharacterized protein n=1 Tax=Streblomastix strix TaxID=222440 RepID=A0A5J4ULU1_9EUKA|nr:MAG: hypothetical protein EZS28_033105 [Streblomastix strix]
MYDTTSYNSGQVVPDQISPANDAVPLVDNAVCAAGISNEYSCGDHQHSLNISEQISSRDTGIGAAGTSTAYSRADHQHILNTDPTVANKPKKIQAQEPTEILIIILGLRISRSGAGCGIYLRTGTQIIGTVQNQQQIVSQPSNFEQSPLGLTIGLSSESGVANRGLRTNADGSTLTFNGSVIVGTGATNGAANESVNYSTRNPILWGVNSTGTEGGFYSDRAKVYWRAHSLTMGSVPP